jgi:hypothetical protein
MEVRFTPKREDGRSNAQVIIDMISLSLPGTVFTYEQLSELLFLGADVKRHRIQQIVNHTNRRLLIECQRRLHNVPTVGYRLAKAEDHRGLSLMDKRKSDHQFTKGLNTLRHVRWDELEANARAAHEGTLMMMEAVFANQSALDKRLRKIEDLLRDITVKRPLEKALLAIRGEGLDREAR